MVKPFRFNFIRNMLLLAALFVAGMPSPVSAADYPVNAVVPFDPPVVAAVFDASLDGKTLDGALTTVFGTCENMTPNGAVVIMRNSVAIGSTTCDGTFSLQITLLEGANVLIPKTVNASGNYGPDGAAITITLSIPVTPPGPGPNPDPGNGGVPPNPTVTITSPVSAEDQQAANGGAENNLTAIPTTPFSIIDSSNEVTIQVVVGGGETPYNITLNWGDGSVESRSVSSPGTYLFTHTYQKNGNYKVQGKVLDARGSLTKFEYAVVSKLLQTQPKKTTTLPTAKTPWWQTANGIAAILVGAFFFLPFITYYFGFRKASRILSKRIEDMQKKQQLRKQAKNKRFLAAAKKRKKRE